MARTTSANVEAILGDHYDSNISLAAFIATATAMVDRVVDCDSDGDLDATTLELIERWLTAHLYAHADQIASQKQTGRASATFQGKTGMGLESTHYGQTALNLDFTGCLRSVGKKPPKMTWLGLPPSEQTDYVDRD